MSKPMLTEQGFIFRFVEAVFNAVVRQRNKALQKAAERDPEFQKIISNLEANKRSLEAWVAQHPEMFAKGDDLRKVLQSRY